MEEQTLDYLNEARKRLTLCIMATLACFAVLSIKATTVYDLVATPLVQHLSTDTKLIAINLTSGFLAPYKLTLFIALILTLPFCLFHIWKFIAPALYKHERIKIWPLVMTSTTLFYTGVCFGYFVVLPAAIKFLTQAAPSTVTIHPDINAYLNFVFRLCFAFGIGFQIPIVTFTLAKLKILSSTTIKKQRPYVIIFAFTLGMLLTPPDIVSQIMLALPLWGLFEIGFIIGKFSIKEQPHGKQNA